ncbi:MAG: hypothetical protein K2X86_07605 [Cytophagaceae bacterium]|nr:hypothetical protein [Cytophagaceae bacterium]
MSKEKNAVNISTIFCGILRCPEGKKLIQIFDKVEWIFFEALTGTNRKARLKALPLYIKK